MDNVVVPESALLPNVSGLKGRSAASTAPLRHFWGAMGAAEDCMHRARQYTLDRKQSTAAAATPTGAEEAADMQTEIALGLQASLRVGRLMDERRWRRR